MAYRDEAGRRPKCAGMCCIVADSMGLSAHYLKTGPGAIVRTVNLITVHPYEHDGVQPPLYRLCQRCDQPAQGGIACTVCLVRKEQARPSAGGTLPLGDDLSGSGVDVAWPRIVIKLAGARIDYPAPHGWEILAGFRIDYPALRNGSAGDGRWIAQDGIAGNNADAWCFLLGSSLLVRFLRRYVTRFRILNAGTCTGHGSSRSIIPALVRRSAGAKQSGKEYEPRDWLCGFPKLCA